MSDKISIKITKNGPYILKGKIPLKKESIETDSEGFPLGYKETEILECEDENYFCRCGHSHSKPFCDSTHKQIKFDGNEIASRKNYEEEAICECGHDLDLKDNEKLCSGAGFCNGREGNTWDLIKNKDEKSKEIAIKQACHCTSGRLVIHDKKTCKEIEPKLEKSVSFIHESWKKVDGPIFVKGGIPIESSDGYTYEIRNRVTLCRCGKSKNMPFCDSSHREK